MSTTRNESMDVLKGIGILAVVLGHYYVPEVVERFVFSFHMPLFFVVSGYFFSQRDFVTNVKKDVRRMLLPYFFSGMLCVFVAVVKGVAKGTAMTDIRDWMVAVVWGSGSNNSGAMFACLPAIGAVWFLLALFWCRNIFNVLYGRKHYRLTVLLLSMGAIVLCQYIFMPLSFLQGVSAMFFYMLGNDFRRHEDTIEEMANKWILTLSFFVWLPIAYFCDMSMVRCYYSCLPFNIVGAVFALLFLYFVSSRYLAKVHPVSEALSWLGRYSLVILCFHIVELNFFPYYNVALVISDKSHVDMAFVLAILFVAKMCLLVMCAWASSSIAILKRVFSLK